MIQKNDKQILIERVYEIGEEIEVPLLHFSLFEDLTGFVHAFTTRKGGVSMGDCSSMNLSFSRGDEEAAVRENYRRIAKALGVTKEQFVCSDQTHTTNIKRVTREDLGKGVTRPKDYTDVDGLITNEAGILLSTFYADCVPLYVIDPVKKAIGLSHSGWRGTVNKMGKVTIEAMQKAFGSKPEDLYCAIGPSICQDCYEVSKDVANAFLQAFPEHMDEILIQKSEEKFQLDLWKANELIFLEAGVLKEHLTVTNICTCCNPLELFSHRASHGKRGNLAAFLMIKDE